MIVVFCTAMLIAACTSEGVTISMPNQTGVPGTTPGASRGPTLRYVALGDSYTIGTSAAESDRWPNQLVRRLPRLNLVANLGVNGFTSQDVIDLELPRLDGLRPDFVSLLIGVNDVVRDVPPAVYRANVARILDRLVALVGAGHVAVVTTPDYTVTPAGADFGNPVVQSAAIRAFNGILSEVAAGRGVTVVDIYPISLRAATDPTLVAGDGLHPSGAQYALWVERIGPVLEALLAGQDPVVPPS
jgi:lysophospholipase L1-like esterase